MIKNLFLLIFLFPFTSVSYAVDNTGNSSLPQSVVDDRGSEFADDISNTKTDNETAVPIRENDVVSVPKEVENLRRIHEKALEAKRFVKEHGMNQEWCMLLDFSYDLYTKRFFVYDLKNNKIIRSELVSHGNGLDSTPEEPVFSNEVGSCCSSLGKYKVGKRAYSNWGIHVHYKLHGLEKTNSNAFKRIVVLHSYEKAACDFPTFLSNGCPIVCDEVMRYLDKKLSAATKPTLLWIFQ